MSKQSQTTQAQADKKRSKKTKPPVVKEVGRVNQLIERTDFAFREGSVEGQAEMLGQLALTQQQSLVRRIGDVEGNRHASQVVETYHADQAEQESELDPTSEATPGGDTLTVGEPGDVYEQEAERVAESVMNMPASMPPVPPGNGGARTSSPVTTSESPSSPEPAAGPAAGGRASAPVRSPVTALEPEELYEQEVEEGNEQPMRMPFLAPPPPPAGEDEGPPGGEGRPAPRWSDLHVSRQGVTTFTKARRAGDALAQRAVRPPAHDKPNRCQTADCLQEAALLKASVRRSEEEEWAREREREARARVGGGISAELTGRIRDMQGNGQALPDGERRFFETRMGYDFSQVRIRDDGEAAQVSRELQARAFTLGTDVAFGEGEYRPGTYEGRRLLAHELTHVVQQGGAQPLTGPTGMEGAGREPETGVGAESPEAAAAIEKERARQAAAEKEEKERAQNAQAAEEQAQVEKEKEAAASKGEKGKSEAKESPEETVSQAGEKAGEATPPGVESYLEGEEQALKDALAGRTEPLARVAEALRTQSARDARQVLVDQAQQTTGAEVHTPLGTPTRTEVQGELPPPAPDQVAEAVHSQREEVQTVHEAQRDGFQKLAERAEEKEVVPQEKMVEQAGVRVEDQAAEEADLAQNPEFESRNYRRQAGTGAQRRGPTDAGAPPNLDVTRGYRGQELTQQRVAGGYQVGEQALETGAVLRADYGQHAIYPSEEVEGIDLEEEGLLPDASQELEGVAEVVEEAAREEEEREADPDAPCREEWEKRRLELEEQQEALEKAQEELETDRREHEKSDEALQQEWAAQEDEEVSLDRQEIGIDVTEWQLEVQRESLRVEQNALERKRDHADAQQQALAMEQARLEAERARLQQQEMGYEQSVRQHAHQEQQVAAMEGQLDQKETYQEQTGQALEARHEQHEEQETALEEAWAALEEQIAAGCPQPQGGGGGGGPLPAAAEAAAQDAQAMEAQAQAIEAERQELEARRAMLAEQVAYDAEAITTAAEAENDALLAEFDTLSAAIEVEAQEEVAQMLADAEEQSEAILSQAEADAEARRQQGERDAEQAIRDAEGRAASLLEEEDPGPILAAGRAEAQRILSAMETDVQSILDTAQDEVKSLLEQVEQAAGLRTEQAVTEQEVLAQDTADASATIAEDAGLEVEATVDQGIQTVDHMIAESDQELRNLARMEQLAMAEVVDAWSAAPEPGATAEEEVVVPQQEPVEDLPPAAPYIPPISMYTPPVPSDTPAGSPYSSPVSPYVPPVSMYSPPVTPYTTSGVDSPPAATSAYDPTLFTPASWSPDGGDTPATQVPLPYEGVWQGGGEDRPPGTPPPPTGPATPPPPTEPPTPEVPTATPTPGAPTATPAPTSEAAPTPDPATPEFTPTVEYEAIVPTATATPSPYYPTAGYPAYGPPQPQQGPEGVGGTVTEIEECIAEAFTGLDEDLSPSEQAVLVLDALRQVDELQTPVAGLPFEAPSISSPYGSSAMNVDQVRMISMAFDNLNSLDLPEGERLEIPAQLRTEVIYQAAGYDPAQTWEDMNATTTGSDFQTMYPNEQATVLVDALQSTPGFNNLPPVERATAMANLVDGMQGVSSGVKAMTVMTLLQDFEAEAMTDVVGALETGDQDLLAAGQEELTALAYMHKAFAPAFISQFSGFTPEEQAELVEDMNADLDRGIDYINQLTTLGGGGWLGSGMEVGESPITASGVVGAQTVTLPQPPYPNLPDPVLESMRIFGVQDPAYVLEQVPQDMLPPSEHERLQEDLFGPSRMEQWSQQMGFEIPSDDQVVTAMEAVEGLEGLPTAEELEAAWATTGFDPAQSGEAVDALVESTTFEAMPPVEQANMLLMTLYDAPGFGDLPPAHQALNTIQLIDQLENVPPEVRRQAMMNMLHGLERDVVAGAVESTYNFDAEVPHEEAYYGNSVADLVQAGIDLDQLAIIHQALGAAFATQQAGVSPDFAELVSEQLGEQFEDASHAMDELIGAAGWMDTQVWNSERLAEGMPPTIGDNNLYNDYTDYADFVEYGLSGAVDPLRDLLAIYGTDNPEMAQAFFGEEAGTGLPGNLGYGSYAYGLLDPDLFNMVLDMQAQNQELAQGPDAEEAAGDPLAMPSLFGDVRLSGLANQARMQAEVRTAAPELLEQFPDSSPQAIYLYMYLVDEDLKESDLYAELSAEEMLIVQGQKDDLPPDLLEQYPDANVSHLWTYAYQVPEEFEALPSMEGLEPDEIGDLYQKYTDLMREAMPEATHEELQEILVNLSVDAMEHGVYDEEERWLNMTEETSLDLLPPEVTQRLFAAGLSTDPYLLLNPTWIDARHYLDVEYEPAAWAVAADNFMIDMFEGAFAGEFVAGEEMTLGHVIGQTLFGLTPFGLIGDVRDLIATGIKYSRGEADGWEMLVSVAAVVPSLDALKGLKYFDEILDSDIYRGAAWVADRIEMADDAITMGQIGQQLMEGEGLTDIEIFTALMIAFSRGKQAYGYLDSVNRRVESPEGYEGTRIRNPDGSDSYIYHDDNGQLVRQETVMADRVITQNGEGQMLVEFDDGRVVYRQPGAEGGGDLIVEVDALGNVQTYVVGENGLQPVEQPNAAQLVYAAFFDMGGQAQAEGGASSTPHADVPGLEGDGAAGVRDNLPAGEGSAAWYAGWVGERMGDTPPVGDLTPAQRRAYDAGLPFVEGYRWSADPGTADLVNPEQGQFHLFEYGGPDAQRDARVQEIRDAGGTWDPERGAFVYESEGQSVHYIPAQPGDPRPAVEIRERTTPDGDTVRQVSLLDREGNLIQSETTTTAADGTTQTRRVLADDEGRPLFVEETNAQGETTQYGITPEEYNNLSDEARQVADDCRDGLLLREDFRERLLNAETPSDIARLQGDMQIAEAFSAQLDDPRFQERFEMVFDPNASDQQRLIMCNELLVELAPCVRDLAMADGVGLTGIQNWLAQSLQARFGDADMAEALQHQMDLVGQSANPLEALAGYKNGSAELYQLDLERVPDLDDPWSQEVLNYLHERTGATEADVTFVGTAMEALTANEADWDQVLQDPDFIQQLDGLSEGFGESFRTQFLDPYLAAADSPETQAFMRDAFLQGGILPGHAEGMRAFCERLGMDLAFRQTPSIAGMWGMMGVPGKPGHWGFPEDSLIAGAQQAGVFDAINELYSERSDEYQSLGDMLSTEVGGHSIKSIRDGDLMGLAYNLAMTGEGPALIRSDYDAAVFLYNGVPLNNAQADALTPFLDAAATGRGVQPLDANGYRQLMDAVSDGNRAEILEIMERYLGEEYVAQEILHSTHFTFFNPGTTEPVLGHPGSLFVIGANQYGYVPEAQVGSWAEQQGLDWPQRWENEIPTQLWNESDMIDFQSCLTSLEQLPLDLQGPAASLISDTNPQFPLSVQNAAWALAGPEGAVPQVAGPGGEGADVVFIQDGEVVLRREIKSIAGSAQGTFNREISHAARQVGYNGEVLVQIESGRDAQSLIRRFRGCRSPEALEKYEGVNIVIADSSGNILYNGPLASRFMEE